MNLIGLSKQFISDNLRPITLALGFTLILLVTPVTAAKKEVNTRIQFNKNVFPLTISEAKTEIVPGLSKEDMDQFNTNPTPEKIKLFMASIAPEYGINWKLVYAIGYHESGNYKSSLGQRNNNFFGRKASSGTYAAWSTPEEGIRNQFEYLKNRYFNRGLDTPAKINPVYAEDSSWHYKVESVMASL